MPRPLPDGDPRGSPPGDDPGAEHGAAVVDFVLVSVLLILLFLTVFQVGLALHVRNVLISSAADGARHAANADRGPADGVARTREAVAQALSGELAAAADVNASLVAGPGGIAVVEVSVSAPLPLLLPIRPVRIAVQGHALEEER